jgi:very-short-patch-repair endonuclease
MVEPILLFPVLVDDNGAVTIDLDSPSLNPSFVRRNSHSGQDEVMAEIAALEEQLGFFDETVSQGVPEIISGLIKFRPDWPWTEAIKPDSLNSAGKISAITEPGIYNRAALFSVPGSPFTKGLESELASLSKMSDAQLRGTALSDWLSGDAADHAPLEGRLLEVLPVNQEQRASVRSAMSQPLTVITGPPGTGKSQVVTNLLINAAWSGKRVLFASKNHKAVDVVEQRINGLSSKKVLLRLGTKHLQSGLAEYLTDLLANPATLADQTDFDEAIDRNRREIQELEDLNQKLEHIVNLRNATDAIDKEVQLLREQVGEDFFDASRALRSADVDAAIDRLSQIITKIAAARNTALRRLYWPLQRSSCHEDLNTAIADLNASINLWGITPPNLTSKDYCLVELAEFAKQMGEAADVNSRIAKYFESLDKLASYPSYGEITKKVCQAEARLADSAEEIWSSWLDLSSKRLSSDERKKLTRYATLLKMLLDAGDSDALTEGIAKSYRKLMQDVGSLFPCWAVTSLSAKGRIPFEPGYFDLVVFDEASQCDIASALPLLYRAKHAVVIGDPKQLTHIASLKKGTDQTLLSKYGLDRDFPEWSYSFSSLFDVALGISRPESIFTLRDHHRSHADIINFSNTEFYGDKLRIATPYGNLNRPTPRDPGVNWVDIKGRVTRPNTGGALNYDEAIQIACKLRDLVINKGYRGSIGVVTPFRAQASLIQREIQKDSQLWNQLLPLGLLVDTVHKFQGDERDVMVFSPVVSQGIADSAIRFLESNGNLFNVAITRARAQLTVVGDLSSCMSSSIGYLARFASYCAQLKCEDLKEVATAEFGPGYPAVSNPDQVSDWEKVLYQALFSAGIKAIPQYAIDKYRLDLAVFDGDRKLDVEVDGERYHRNWTGELCHRDQLRNQRLYEMDWDVMRFWVYEIRDDLDRCVSEVKAWLNANPQI